MEKNQSISIPCIEGYCVVQCIPMHQNMVLGHGLTIEKLIDQFSHKRNLCHDVVIKKEYGYVCDIMRYALKCGGSLKDVEISEKIMMATIKFSSLEKLLFFNKNINKHIR